jgi:hypothetical protein
MRVDMEREFLETKDTVDTYNRTLIDGIIA